MYLSVCWTIGWFPGGASRCVRVAGQVRQAITTTLNAATHHLQPSMLSQNILYQGLLWRSSCYLCMMLSAEEPMAPCSMVTYKLAGSSRNVVFDGQSEQLLAISRVDSKCLKCRKLRALHIWYDLYTTFFINFYTNIELINCLIQLGEIKRYVIYLTRIKVTYGTVKVTWYKEVLSGRYGDSDGTLGCESTHIIKGLSHTQQYINFVTVSS